MGADASKSGKWVILRTAGMSTLPLAQALVASGIEAWTPAMIERRRIGKKREIKEVPVSLTPGIVFAREEYLHDLAAMARSPSLTYKQWNRETGRMETRGCPYFIVFRHQGAYPRVSDRHLDPLRVAEQQHAPRPKAPTYRVGDQVRLTSAGFEGLVGIVSENDRQYAMVMFPGFVVPVKILASSLLAASVAA